MLADYQKAEISHLEGVINGINEEITKIDEKYRKLAETEKAALTASLDAFNTALDFWKKLETSSDVVRTEEKAEVAEEEDKVVDTLFPENNEPDKKEEVVEDEHYDASGLSNEDDEVLEFEKEETTEETVEETEEVSEDEEEDDEFKDMDTDW